MKNKMEDVRNLLIQTMEELVDPTPDSTMTIEKAKAIADIGQVLINSAKVEVDFIKATDSTVGSKFLPMPIDEQKKLNS